MGSSWWPNLYGVRLLCMSAVKERKAYVTRLVLVVEEVDLLVCSQARIDHAADSNLLKKGYNACNSPKFASPVVCSR